jgi:pyruvate, water dikinase
MASAGLSTGRCWCRSPTRTGAGREPSAAIVTDHGGRTATRPSQAANSGLPAIVGTGDATHVLHEAQQVTISSAEGDEGFVCAGVADWE